MRSLDVDLLLGGWCLRVACERTGSVALALGIRYAARRVANLVREAR